MNNDSINWWIKSTPAKATLLSTRARLPSCHSGIYILQNQILQFLKERERQGFVHTIVSGGQARSDTLNGLKRLAETTVEQNVVVWFNKYFDELVRDGNMFTDLNIAEEQAIKILGFVPARLAADVQSRSSPIEFETAYQTRFGTGRIKFAIKRTEQLAPRMDTSRKAGLHLLDAPERLESVERPLPTVVAVRAEPSPSVTVPNGSARRNGVLW